MTENDGKNLAIIDSKWLNCYNCDSRYTELQLHN